MDGAENVQHIESTIQSHVSVLLGEYGWMFLAALAILFFAITFLLSVTLLYNKICN